MQHDQDEPTGAEIEARYSAIFGARGWRHELAAALGYSGPSKITRAIQAERAPPVLVVAVEFLEITAIARWPARWSALADLAKAHRQKRTHADDTD